MYMYFSWLARRGPFNRLPEALQTYAMYIYALGPEIGKSHAQ